MKKVEKILFPIDLTEKFEALLPWVSTFVKSFDATLYVLFVTPGLADYASFYVPHANLSALEKDALKAAEQKMGAVAKEVFKDFPKLKTMVVQGAPAEKILDAAHKEKVDLIIMGTHGRKGLERAIFGSVCDKVVRSSKIPVLTIYPEKA